MGKLDDEDGCIVFMLFLILAPPLAALVYHMVGNDYTWTLMLLNVFELIMALVICSLILYLSLTRLKSVLPPIVLFIVITIVLIILTDIVKYFMGIWVGSGYISLLIVLGVIITKIGDAE